MVLLPLALLGMFSAGCSGGGDKPAALPTLSPTQTASSSPSAVPVVARAKTPEGADAFARFYFDQLNIAFANSDASIIRAFSEPACGTCELYAEGLVDSRKQGLRIAGRAFLVKDVAAAPVQLGRAPVEVFGSIPSTTQVEASGRIVQTVPAQGAFHFTLTLVAVSTGWSVDDIRIDKA